MPRIRRVQIRNFRGIENLDWFPLPGVNCLIGPGDSGKSAILDAIDLCLGVRRDAFADSDFHNLDVSSPVVIDVTIGELDDDLISLERYGKYLRTFNAAEQKVEDEPAKDGETVLTLRLTVESDLEPVRTLYSAERLEEESRRDLSRADRTRLAPTRIGGNPAYNLGWRRGSVLNRFSDAAPDASQAIIEAARSARERFGEVAEANFRAVLDDVTKIAKSVGVRLGAQAKAMLDMHSIALGAGTVSLHDERNVPLGNLGEGSKRLLVAGLQELAAKNCNSVILVIDELEHGLEPHRLMRFLASIGAKKLSKPPLQAFLSTHSPVAIAELTSGQLFIVRPSDGRHEIKHAESYDVQATIRACPEAMLALAVLVCEGKSEVGFVRGLDLWRAAQGRQSIFALGVALVNGGGVNNMVGRADGLLSLGYRTACFRDDDKQPSVEEERAFLRAGGHRITWRPTFALEDELFRSVPVRAVGKLLDYAVERKGEHLVNEHIKTASKNAKNLESARAEINGSLSAGTRELLGRAARTKENDWFKSVTAMEHIGCEIVGPCLDTCDASFVQTVDAIFDWCCDGA